MIKIVIISPDAAFRHKIHSHLTTEGYGDISLADLGQQDDWHLPQEKEEGTIVLLDMSGYGSNALRYLQKIKEENALAMVIALVPKHQLNLEISAMRYGAFDDLQVPFYWSELSRKIQEARKSLKKREAYGKK